MKVTYIGPFTEVYVPEIGAVAANGVPLDVDGELSARLLEQRSNWALADGKPVRRSVIPANLATETGDIAASSAPYQEGSQ